MNNPEFYASIDAFDDFSGIADVQAFDASDRRGPLQGCKYDWCRMHQRGSQYQPQKERSLRIRRGRRYRVELRDNTDYRRFDDTLRILIDCSREQADKSDLLLAQHAQSGALKYGLHRSDTALMTCLVFNLENSEHIHFVDGSDGGFTAAAKKMKAVS